jgi:hypothetical protein
VVVRRQVPAAAHLPQEISAMFRIARRTAARTLDSLPTHHVRFGLGLMVVASLLAFAVRVHAQTNTPAGTSAITVRPMVGALVATGGQHEVIENAVLIGGQASYALHPNVAVIGTFGWSPNREKLTPQQPALDLYQYDLGLEGRLNDVTQRSRVITRPYAALGAGARTYDPRNVPNADAESNLLVYSAAGVDLRHAGGRFGVRLEARDNVTWFKGARGELAELQAHNDLQLSAGLTFGL